MLSHYRRHIGRHKFKENFRIRFAVFLNLQILKFFTARICFENFFSALTVRKVSMNVKIVENTLFRFTSAKICLLNVTCAIMGV